MRLVLLLTLILFPSLSFGERNYLAECEATYSKYFPHCSFTKSYETPKCVYDSLKGLQRKDVFLYQPRDSDPVTPLSQKMYRREKEYKERLASLKRDAKTIVGEVICFAERVNTKWEYDLKKQGFYVKMRGLGETISTDYRKGKTYKSGFVLENLKPKGHLNRPLFIRSNETLGLGIEEVQKTHSRALYFFTLNSLKNMTYGNPEHPSQMTARQRKEMRRTLNQLGLGGRSWKALLNQKNKSEPKYLKHFGVNLVSVYFCQERGDDLCFDEYKFNVSTRGRVY